MIPREQGDKYHEHRYKAIIGDSQARATSKLIATTTTETKGREKGTEASGAENTPTYLPWREKKENTQEKKPYCAQGGKNRGKRQAGSKGIQRKRRDPALSVLGPVALHKWE